MAYELAQYSPPPPREIVSENSTEQWTDYTCNGIDGAEDASEGTSLLGRNRESNDGVCTGCDTSSTSASNCAPNDERCTAGCHRTDETAEFEDGNGEKKHNLQRKILVRFAPS
jgi:hypothetical protein